VDREQDQVERLAEVEVVLPDVRKTVQVTSLSKSIKFILCLHFQNELQKKVNVLFLLSCVNDCQGLY
jgi:hypothetical protein